MVDFYHKKGIDVLKIGCTLSNLSNISLHMSTTAKFFFFTENDKDLLKNTREHRVGELPIVFTRKAVVGETFIRNSTNLCKNFVGIDASQLFFFFHVSSNGTGLYTSWKPESESGKLKPRQNKTKSFENMVMSCF